MAQAFVSQIHLIVHLEGRLDAFRLQKASRLLMDVDPVLGCLYRPRFLRPYWRRIDREQLDTLFFFRVIKAAGPSSVQHEEDFLTEELDPRIEPPLKILHLMGDENDRLLIKTDHQVTDAAGVKYLVRRLADIYSRLEREPGYRPKGNDSPRDQAQIYRRLLPSKLPALTARYFRDLKTIFRPMTNLTFPAGRERTGKPKFIIRRLGPEKTRRMKDFSAGRGATLNDMATAMMFRALAAATQWDGRKTLRLVGTVDLRRYLDHREPQSIGNLSGWYFLSLGPRLGKDLAETLSFVAGQTIFLKQDHIGLAFNFFSYLILSCLPYGIRAPYMNMNVRWLVRLGNMPPTLTNMGLISDRSLVFGHIEASSAYLLVPPGVPPILTLGLSGFKDSLTLSSGFFPSAISESKMEYLFDLFEQEVPGQ